MGSSSLPSSSTLLKPASEFRIGSKLVVGFRQTLRFYTVRPYNLPGLISFNTLSSSLQQHCTGLFRPMVICPPYSKFSMCGNLIPGPSAFQLSRCLLILCQVTFSTESHPGSSFHISIIISLHGDLICFPLPTDQNSVKTGTLSGLAYQDIMLSQYITPHWTHISAVAQSLTHV